jgi:DNA-binding NarL/FixJ family response regulator
VQEAGRQAEIGGGDGGQHKAVQQHSGRDRDRASGFLLKDVSPEQLVAAVRLVRSGDALLAPSITRRLVERFAPRADGPPAVHGDLSNLTSRELEVLGLLARGLSNAELARI